ncbi:MAG TPA: MFS transporter [Solirubrobacteraceae bacterium]|jgi:DHA2 family methylenomycin A resistance protein-like MFS transporter|nr:MFS transporter [Solirubrobacteraceae bacterium]
MRTRELRTTGRSDWVDRRGRLVLVGVCLGFFMIQLDATIVNVALPAIGRDVGGSFGGLQWVVDSYTLVLAAGMLAAGSLADRLGTRRVFELGLVIFTLGSAAAAAAPDLVLLIFARTLQGVGAAALLPCSLALTADEFPAGPPRARALGVWGGIGSLGMACGPLFGGLAVGLVSWRLVFVINLPAAMLALWLVRRFVAHTPPAPGGRFDVGGFLLGTLGLGALTAGFIEAGALGWSSPRPIGLVAGGVVAGVGFRAVERRRARPLVPLDLFASRPFTAAVGVGFLFNLCLYGAIFCLSVYLQRSRSASALETGIELLPLTVVVGLGALASGRLTARYGPRRPMLAGLGLAAAGAGLLSLAGPASPLGLVLAGSICLGLCSLAMPAMTSVAINAVHASRIGLASGVLNAARQSGGALGVAVLGSLLVAGGHRPSLAGALPVALGGYAVAIGLAWIATRPGVSATPAGERGEVAGGRSGAPSRG